MNRNAAALGIGLLLTAVYLGVVGVLDSQVMLAFDEELAFGYGVAVFASSTAGGWLLLGILQRREGPR
jgi:hypothetical protein